MTSTREKREVGRGGLRWQPTADRPYSPLQQWEAEHVPTWRKRMRAFWGALRRPVGGFGIAVAAFFIGISVAATPEPSAGPADRDLRSRLYRAEGAVQARTTDLELLRLESARLETIMRNSARYRIPADLAEDIYDIALSEGIDPGLAYRITRVESGFVQRAVSPVGAVGLTQLMPTTAFEMDPSLRYSDLFDRKTNLRLGFRYLRVMLDRYDGDLRLALLAYNRGPGTVDGIRRAGGDPANGYARAVMRP